MSKARAFEAAHRLDLAGVREALARQPSLLQATDRQRRNLLLVACSARCEELGLPPAAAARLVSFLLDAGADVESAVIADGYPCNAVWFAVARGKNRKVVELLVRRGGTPRGLFAAGWHDDLPMIELLVRLGAEVDERAEDETPFFHCWKHGRFAAAELLLRRGADPNFRDSKLRSALHHALDRGYEPARVRVLMRYGASAALADARGVSATLKASRKRDPAYLAALR